MEDLNWEQIAGQLSGENFSDKKPVKKETVEASEFFRNELEQSKKMLHDIDTHFQAKRFDSEVAWKNVQAQIHPPQLKVIASKKARKEAVLSVYKYAAILVVAVLLG